MAVVSISLFSCRAKKMAFTPDIQKQNSFSESTLKQIQFYTSDIIILYNTKQDGNVYIDNGKILIDSDKECEKIIIPKNTPCVLEKIIDQDKFVLSFEYGKSRLLYFTNNSGQCYSLAAKEWKDGIGKLNYANNHYLTNSGTVFLTVKVKKLNKIRKKQRVITGRKI